jgi:3-methyladenine DNA glycosylase AlkD
MEHDISDVLKKLRQQSSRSSLEGMGRFGIVTSTALGVSVPKIRALAKQIGRDHDLALLLWKSDIHEARMLASMVDDPKLVTQKQMEGWVKDFHSWDICDQVCGNLFDKTSFGYIKAIEWSKREEEYVKRAGFSLMAYIAVHDKKLGNKELAAFLPIIERESTDERNFVRKAVNWALRQIGKRNAELNRMALIVADRIRNKDSKSAKWIAGDAIRELTSKQVQARLK